jgi:hypothetical protein
MESAAASIDPSDTIVFDPMYFASLNKIFLDPMLGNLHEIDHDIIIDGDIGTGSVTIDGSSSLPIFIYSGTNPATSVTLDNINFQNATNSAISISNGDLSISNSMISSASTTGSGGAINIGTGSLTMDNVTISGCTAAVAGGAINIGTGSINLGSSDSVTISGCSVTNPTSDVAGGAINITNVTGDSIIKNTTIYSSTASSTYAGASGGAINVGTISSGEILELDSTTIHDCSAQNDGGGINIDTGDLQIDMNTSLYLCHAGRYGGAINVSGNITFGVMGKNQTDTIHNCDALYRGGAISETSGTLTVAGLHIDACSVTSSVSPTYGEGGGIYLGSCNSSLMNLTVSNCHSSGYGGGIAIIGFGSNAISTAHQIMGSSTIELCTAVYKGGGFYGIHSDYSIVNSTFSKDSATDELTAEGGGIYVNYPVASNSPCRISGQSTITGCFSAVHGGGIATGEPVTDGAVWLVISDSTISDNTAGTDDNTVTPRGGGIYILQETVPSEDSDLSGSGILTLSRSTVTYNVSKGFGGGIYSASPADPLQVNIDESTIDHNIATEAGGGIWIDAGLHGSIGEILLMLNSTISDNSVQGAEGMGAGINLIADGGVYDFLFCTIYNNNVNTESLSGGGMAFQVADLGDFQPTTTVNVNGTVLSGNTNASTNPLTNKPTEDDMYVPDPGFLKATINFNYSALGTKDGIAPDNTNLAYAVTYGAPPYGNMLYIAKPTLHLSDFLGYHGGPTETYMPISSYTVMGSDTLLPSPLIDFIPPDVYGDVVSDQRGFYRPYDTGITDSEGIANRDVGSVEVHPIQSFIVNPTTAAPDGEVQRSRLTKIVINFDNPVDASTLTDAGAITLTRTAATSAGTVGTVVQTGATGANGRINVSPSSGTVTSVTLTFDNANSADVTAGVEYGSLADGRWQLAIPSLNFTTVAGDQNLRRLYGDINNDGTVDGADFGAFGNQFGSTLGPNVSGFDYNNDGTIDGTDFGEFGDRFGVTL